MNKHLQTAAREIGLLVDERKTKYMNMSAAGNIREPQNLRIGNKDLKGYLSLNT